MILCDIGNTTFHFKSNNKEFKLFHNEDFPNLNEIIYFISVNQKATNKLLKKFPNSINIEKFIKFDTSYVGMGIDRKVACLNIKNAIIVDAGSAITVDVVENSKHSGGFILPGITALASVYPNISEKLKFELNQNINLNSIPLNTNNAINYAIFQSIILPIKNIDNNYNIIFTGGDGLMLSKYFKNSLYNKNLIFDNIKQLLDKMQKDNR
jgi:type III pantothenate kinase